MNLIGTKRYLGDGVYCEFDGYQIKLTTSVGGSCEYDSNVIYLEPQVIHQLLDYVKCVNAYNHLHESKQVDPSIISIEEISRSINSDPNDTGWEK
jgi:hypothetical protein